MPQAPLSPEHRHWRINRRWIAGLLLAWFIVTFVVSWNARSLTFPFFDWPFSFWVGAQGAHLVYLAIIVIYAWRMNKLDDETATEAPASSPALSPTLPPTSTGDSKPATHHDNPA